jgi:hypothetical protein
MTRGLLTGVILATVLAFGCSVRMIDFTVISSKNANVKGKSYGQRVEGKDCAGLLLGLIPVTGRFQPNMKEAVDRAIEAAGPGYDALIDGVIDNNVLFLVLYNQACFVVEGTPINTKEASTSSLEPTDRVVYHHSRR